MARLLNEFNPTVPGFTNPKVLGFLYSLVTEFQPNRCVELGSYMGRSASAISLALAALGGGRKLTCVDIFEAKVDAHYVQLPLIRQIMEYAGDAKGLYCDTTKIRSISDAFDLTVARCPWMQGTVEKITHQSHGDWNREGAKFDFSYIDADHTYVAVRQDTMAVLRFANERHVMVFDDYSTQFPGVVRFVEELRDCDGVQLLGQEHPDIALLIDEPQKVLADLRK